MADTRPLLSIAIPTWNRAGFLRELLDSLAQQGLDPAEVELFVSDNASTDDTAAIVREYVERHALPLRYYRQRENLGSDANFIFCYQTAAGRYFWLLSDDDVLVPGAVEQLLSHLRGQEYDLIYLTSYGFRSDWRGERYGDPLGRRFHRVRSALRFAKLVNMMITFISGMVINKERLEGIPHEAPAAFQGTQLIQLAWTLPLLREHRQSLVLWERLVAGRQGNSGGYSLGEVFGRSLLQSVHRCLPDRPRIARVFVNFSLRRWFPEFLYEQRIASAGSYTLDRVPQILTEVHGKNFRYWLFTWPVLRLPLPLARLWFLAGKRISGVLYVVQLPGFWRKEI